DARSHLATITNPMGYRVKFDYDKFDQITTITTPGGVTRFQSTDGRVTAITDPLNNTTQYAYDQLGRLSKVTEPTGAVTTYSYDPAGQTMSITDALGHTV